MDQKPYDDTSDHAYLHSLGGKPRRYSDPDLSSGAEEQFISSFPNELEEDDDNPYPFPSDARPVGGYPFPGGMLPYGGLPFPGGGGQYGPFPFPGGGGQYGGFPPAPPFGVPGFPPGGGPSGGPSGGPPATPPPAFVPQPPLSTYAVDPGGIRGCLFRFTYIWLDNGRSFWFYPIFVGRTSTAGYRWRNFRWVYFGIDLRRIRSFQCY